MFCCSSRDDGKKANQSAPRQDVHTTLQDSVALQHQAGKPVGVGIVFQPDSTGALHVKSLSAGGPAEKCGLVHAGDVLHEIDGHHVYRKPVAQLAPLILGQEGTIVRLGLQRGTLQRLVVVELKRGWTMLPQGAHAQQVPPPPSPASKWSQVAPNGAQLSNFSGPEGVTPSQAGT
jgi:C-terminal processing protease CtpA/Prc